MNADPQSMVAKREPATTYAWVSGNKAAGYHLYITNNPKTRDFRALDMCAFDNFRAAQAIANAIRKYARGDR